MKSSDSVNQDQPEEFTAAELRAAFSLAMPAAAVEELVESMLFSPDAIEEEVIGIGYTGDTLALLSLVSDELKGKVESYLRRMGGQQREWLKRRRELERVLKPDEQE